ncbi:hypothetical protein NOJ16_33800, partial [Neorhizobium galegae]|nr:hypothetical protein [Neorhizobium galegae]
GESATDYLRRMAARVVPVADYEILELDEANERVRAEEQAHALVQFPPLTPIDFKLGMLTLNITPDQIDDIIEKMPEPDRTIAKIYWTSARKFLRDDPLIEEIAAIMGKTSDEIDAAWRYASGT